MRLAVLTLTLVLAAFGISAGADWSCEIEDWRYRYDATQTLWIEGTTTCQEGKLLLRAYDSRGEKPKFLGVGDGYIQGHVFKLYIDDVETEPSALEIRAIIYRRP